MSTDPAIRPSNAEVEAAERGLALLRQLAWQAEQHSEEASLAEAAAAIIARGDKLNRTTLAAAFMIEESSLDDKIARAIGRGQGIRAMQRTPLADLKLGRIRRINRK
jgi:hypothetical protein